MNMIITELITSFFGSLGFSMVFNVRRRNLLPAAIGGVIVCLSYQIPFHIFSLGVFLSSLIAGAVCQIYSEALARILKSPATVFYITALIPLIPGGSLYRTMEAVVEKDLALFQKFGIQTLYTTLGLSIGISFITAILFLIRSGKSKK
ncbi:MAG: threonine/serine exporter family protein [Clostridia bacterium]|nr:threonine/serine exporter family protein [Clostridia bacterium]